jgi:hypothetical protein
MRDCREARYRGPRPPGYGRSVKWMAQTAQRMGGRARKRSWRQGRPQLGLVRRSVEAARILPIHLPLGHLT